MSLFFRVSFKVCKKCYYDQKFKKRYDYPKTQNLILFLNSLQKLAKKAQAKRFINKKVTEKKFLLLLLCAKFRL
jgi:hypothetical protein